MRTLRLFFVTLLVLVSSVLRAQLGNASADKYVPGRVLVKFRPNVRPIAIRAAHLAVAGEIVQSFDSVEGLQLVKVPAASRLSDALATYRANPDVLYAEPDYIVHSFQTPNDPLFSSLWSLLNSGQSGGTPGADIKATQAWNITTGSSSVIVAVIDTGVDYNHPDLAANIFTGPICPGGVVCHGINTVQGSALSPNDPFDDNGHGTHVSGTIGALGNNALGVTGINWNVTILPCKFLGPNGAGDVAGAIKCLDFIKNLKDTGGLNIVASNNSWGGGDFSQALQDAIDRQRQSGIMFIAAAGNDFSNNDVLPAYPASFPLPNIISVAATDRNDHRAFFSNVGKHSVHLGAPGQDILSTLPAATYGLDSGTSMATPHVTGVAALLSAQDPTRDWRSIKNLLLAGGDANADMAQTVSGRRVNAFGSLTCLNSPVTGRLTPTTDIASGSVGVPLVLSVLNINCAQPNGDVQVTVSPGGQTISLTDDGLSPDLSAGDGVYTGSFTPPAPGIYTLTFSTGGTVTVQSLNKYLAAGAVFNYRSITGTNLNLKDDGVAEIASPFPILFGDGSFSLFWVSANGTISFTGAVSSYLHMPLPTGSPFHSATPLVQASTLVAPFWDDLVPQPGTAQNVFWDVIGTAPNRELVVEWRDLRNFDCFSEPDTVKFQTVFFENSSDVLFNYADTVFGGNCVNHDRGNLATEGIQVSADAGTLWGFDGQDVADGMAVVWKTSTASVPPPPTPILTSISPTTANAFGPGFVLTVNGSNFVPESRVTLFGFPRPTTFVSSTQLTAQISATDLDPFLSFPGPFSVIVQTRGLSSIASSNTLSLDVIVPAPNLTLLSPASVPAGSFGFILTVNGTDFAPFATVNFNGQPLISVTLSRTQVTTVVPGDMILSPGTAFITVTNNHGGTSAPLLLSITAGGPAAPIAAPLAYRIQQTLAGRSISTARPNPLAGRFLGWNFARKQGPEYMKQFIRPYGGIFTPSEIEPSSVPAALPSTLATIPPALPGLDLPEPLVSGFLPTAVAVGDFNRDGHVDWVVSNGGSNDLWLYLGNGDGTAQLPRVISLHGQTPTAIAAVDLRGIGILDLVVAEPDSLSVGVLLGNGDGTFAPETLYFSPAPPISLVVADFNRDNHPDVVVGMLAENNVGPVAFFAGDGAGKLLPPVTTPLDREVSPATQVLALAAGDLNNDGIPDLAVTDLNEQDTGTFVYLGQGDGTFKKSQNLGGILNAAIGDLNGDGCPDVVTIDTLAMAAVMLGHCDGTFTLLEPLGFFGEGETGLGMALADVNGDGKLDLITSGISLGIGGAFGQDSGSLISVSFGDGTGNFEPARVYRAQSGMFGLAVADLNGDLHPDLVAASQDADSVILLLNDGTGRFGGPQGRYIGWAQKGSSSTNTLQGPANAPVFMVAADLDGDGRKDLLSMDFGRGFDLPWNLVVSLNDGAGNFQADTKLPVLDGRFGFFGNLVLGDFRGTGLPDIVLTPNHLSVSFTGNFYIFLPNLGAGHFGTPVITNISGLPGVIATGDFNGDGKLDFVMAGGSPGQIGVFLGNGNGTFSAGPSQAFISSPPERLFVGDFNGDGKLDVIVPVRGQLIEFLGNGDGSFGVPKVVIDNILSFSDPASLFEAVDLNHDGRVDLIRRNGIQDDPVPVFKVYFAQADGSFVLQNTYSPYSGQPFNAGFAAGSGSNGFIGDFNGDGIPDIAAFQQQAIFPAARYVQFMLGNGDGTFTPAFRQFRMGVGNTALPSFTTDMNGDGKTDFVELDGFTSGFNIIHSVAPGKSFSLQFVSLPVIGLKGVVRVGLSLPAALPTVLQLSASTPGITIPPSVTVPAGSLTADVNFSVAPGFDITRTFTLTATDGVQSASALASVAVPGGAVGLVMGLGTTNLATILPGQSTPDVGFGVASRGGYQTTINVGCSGAPAGFICHFGSTTIDVPAGSSTGTSLVIDTPAGLPVGDYTFSIVASDVALSQSFPVTVHVGDFSLNVLTKSGSALPTGSAFFRVELPAVNNYAGLIALSCAGLPSATSCLINSSNGGTGQDFAINTTNLAPGDYPFTVTGTAGSISHTASGTLHVGDFGVATVAPTTATLNVGQSTSFNLTVNSVNGFSDQVSLSCATTVDGQPVSGVTCSFSPVNPSFDASGKLTDQITVAVVSRPRSIRVRTLAVTAPWRWFAPLGAMIVLAVVLATGGSNRRGTLTLCCVGLLGLSTIIACGGGSSGGTAGPPPTPTPTPPVPQTVRVEVFGHSTTQFQAPTKTLTTFTVTVQ